jgi:aspartyl-tRNA(Asn)/glutamyl-tRNA(Gln) amidotransferase subunit A
VELLAGYGRRAFSPVEVVEALAERIAEVDGGLGAFTTLCLDRARDEARVAERRYLRGETLGPLTGVPFAAKDIFDSAGVRTTYGSPMFADHVPAADATAVRRAREAGAILVGKTQTHEFAWGITSVNFLMGTSRNPWAPERLSGGSSGGSAVALATHQVPLALGSDTGGSIRVPSSFCGVVGLKPTYGRISLARVWPLARSLDHAGPLARTPSDVALFLAILAGSDAADPATEDAPLGDLETQLHAGLAGFSIGVCGALHLVELTSEAQAAFDDAVRTAEALGARVVEVDFEPSEIVYRTFSTIQRAEALFTHQQAGLFPSRRAEYGDDVRNRLDLAADVTLSDYLAASIDRQRIRAAFARLFQRVDVLLTPIAAGSPLPIGKETLVHGGREIEFRELVMTYTTPQDLAGLPACAVRAGFDSLGIPIGVQLTGPPRAEGRVLRAAQALFEATPVVQRRWPEPVALARESS